MRNRRRLLISIVFGLVVVGLMSVNLSHCQERQQQKGSKLGGYEKPPAANDVPDHRWDIILGRPTDHSVAVRVLAYEDLEGRIASGVQSKQYTAQAPVVRLKKGEPVDFVIDSLAANSRCFYRFEFRRTAADQFEFSDEYTFHTQRAPESSFAFTVQSDSHLDENTSAAVYERTLANVLTDSPDFHLELGDTFMVDKYVRQEISLGQYLAQRYYFGRVCHSVPLFFALGNHDGEPGDRGSNVWATSTRKRYIPNPGPDSFYSGNRETEASIGNVENYYAWSWGNSLFVVLDPFRYTTKRSRGRDAVNGGGSDQQELWNRTLGRTQYDWFKSVLENSDARFKFIFLHNLVGGADRNGRGGIEVAPYFEWGGKGLDGKNEFDRFRPGWGLPIHQLLVKHHVSIVFHGHDHLFVKQDLDGIVYQEVPQPGHARMGNIRSAVEYGYLNGEIQSSSGHIRVNVTSDSARVDYVRSYLPSQESSQRKNGDVSYSYLIRNDQ